ncbi:DUF6910 family protein [Nocardioides dongkuii]|uniref:DUF6910 family protein n=1 Tax=Nocardioides dongkuii TaxID=2760089 RepID=UPI001878B1CF|nr:hypothetical protein [Nocardioides dongkuii]
MRISVDRVLPLRFRDGSPVRAASAVAPYGGGWLVAQDDATHACWWRDGAGDPVRLLPAVAGHEVFDEAHGTKHLKPDLEAACRVPGRDGAEDGVLLLGSGSTPARMRSVLVPEPGGEPVVGDLAPLYARVAEVLGVPPDQLNLEGAAVAGGTVRWFHRGRPAGGLPSASLELPLDDLVAATRGSLDPGRVRIARPREVHLGDGLAVTDAVAVDDRTTLVSAAAEDSPNAYDDGPVVASALAVLVDGGVDGEVAARAMLPALDGRVAKVEGLALRSNGSEPGRREVHLLATVDADDPQVPSSALDLRVTW